MITIANALALIRHSEKEAEAKSAGLGMADLRNSPSNQNELITCLACLHITHKYLSRCPPVYLFHNIQSHSEALIKASIATSVFQSPNHNTNFTMVKPTTCCGKADACVCAQQATCSCGKQSALACTCEKATTENTVAGARCSCRTLFLIPTSLFTI